MMKSLHIPLFATLVFFPSLALSQENCLPALRNDIVRLDENTELSLSIIDQLERSKDSNKNNSVVATFGEYKFDLSQAQVASERIKKLLDLKYNLKQTTNLLISNLSDNSVAAYDSCLRSRSNISYRTSRAVFNDEMFLTVNWHPNYEAKNPAKAVLQIIGGTFADSNSRKIEFDISDKQSEDIPIKRDIYKPTEITIKIDGRTTSAELPYLPRKKIIQDVKIGKPEDRGGREMSSNLVMTPCVYLSPEDRDISIIPGSFKIVYDYKQLARARVDHGKITENERSACQELTVVYESPFKSFASVRAHAEVSVFRAIDR